MATKSTLIAAAIAVIVVVAAAAVVMNYGRDGGGPAVDAVGLKEQPAVNDSYTLSESDVMSETVSDRTYTVTAVNGQNLDVEIATVGSDGSTVTDTQTMTVDDYYANIYFYLEDPDGLPVETIDTVWGEKQVYVVTDSATSGNNRFYTTDYVGVGSHIVYRSEIVITTSAGTQSLVTELTQSSLFTEDASSAIDPDGSSGGQVADTVAVGDYIRWYVTDDGMPYYITCTVTEVDGNWVFYTEEDSDDGDIDREETTINGFLGMLIFTPNSWMIQGGTESIDAGNYGTVLCDVYVIHEDRDEWTEFYVGVDDGVLYRVVEYDDNRVDETVTLYATSLMGDGSAGDPTPGTSANPFGIELSVGDCYTITETEDGRSETTTYTIVAINGGRLTVEEDDGRGWPELEYESAYGFLSEVFVQSGILSGLTPVGSGTMEVDGVTYRYNEYSFISGDETETYRVAVGSNLLLQHTSTEGREVETETLVFIRIASLA